MQTSGIKKDSNYINRANSLLTYNDSFLTLQKNGPTNPLFK